MKTPKSNNTKTITIVVVFLIIVIVIFLATKKRGATRSDVYSTPPERVPGSYTPPVVTSPSSKPPVITPPVEITDYTILRRGMKGEQVKKLQRLINAMLGAIPAPKMSVDGSFGPDTEKKVLYATGARAISYQNAYKKAKGYVASRGLNIDTLLAANG